MKNYNAYRKVSEELVSVSAEVYQRLFSVWAQGVFF
jgi:hypothetical protein